jgi:hypothetical protein
LLAYHSASRISAKPRKREENDNFGTVVRRTT